MGRHLIVLAAFFFIISMAHCHLHSNFLLSGKPQAAKNLRSWPCCDSCGACKESLPPQCQCLDLSPSCHPMCQNCVQSPFEIYPPLYQCKDFITDLCKYKCDASILDH